MSISIEQWISREDESKIDEIITNNNRTSSRSSPLFTLRLLLIGRRISLTSSIGIEEKSIVIDSKGHI
jgi:hypothetical protein